MTEIERKALELINEVTEAQGWRSDWVSRDFGPFHEALCRAIEQHEAFRQEVSDVAEACQTYTAASFIKGQLNRFIIAKPDPLMDAFKAVWPSIDKTMVEALRDQFAKRGLEIREKK